MRQIALLAVLITALLSTASEAAVVSRLFGGALNGTANNFLALAPAPSAGTPRDFLLYIDFDDNGTLAGTFKVGDVTDTFTGASGWLVSDSGGSDVLSITAQSSTNALKFLQFSIAGGDVTNAGTNALPTLNALLASASLPTSLAFGNLGNGLQGYSGSITAVPEPSTMGLLALGAVVGGWRLRRRKAA